MNQVTGCAEGRGFITVALFVAAGAIDQAILLGLKA